MFHLHRLDDDDRLAGGDVGPDLGGDGDHGARHRAGDLAGVLVGGLVEQGLREFEDPGARRPSHPPALSDANTRPRLRHPVDDQAVRAAPVAGLRRLVDHVPGPRRLGVVVERDGGGSRDGPFVGGIDLDGHRRMPSAGDEAGADRSGSTDPPSDRRGPDVVGIASADPRQTHEHLCLGNGLRRSVIGDEAVQQLGVEVGVHDRLLTQDEAAEVDVGDHAQHACVGQCLVETFERLLPVGTVGDDLREHRVVVTADAQSVEHGRVDADAATGRGVGMDEMLDRPAGRQETACRVLGVHACLDRVAAEGDRVLRQTQDFSAGDADLLFHEVDSGDELGHRVLDLQAGVHLHEEELVGPVRRHDELDRARPGVADTARGIARGLTDASTGLGVEQRRRRLLDHLLVPPLQ